VVVDMEDILVAMVTDDEAAAQAVAVLGDLGFGEERVRRYGSREIVAYDDRFRSARGLASRVIGSLVDDKDSMGRYVDYAREGRAALWILLHDRDEANQVIRRLSDDLVFVWYHGPQGVQTVLV
jgi:hypothetical protein